jgi:alpha-galactosidase
MPINKKISLNMNKKYFFQHLIAFTVILFFSWSSIKAQQNSLALTPPMGWSSWYPFVDTINEQKIIETADAIVSTGLRDAGYTILQLDDGWMAKARDEKGRQYADKERFPHGMKFLADYLHERGLKLGIYSSAGATTCAGYPGSYNHEELDAKTYASWGIDYLKYDACGEKEGHSDKELFTRMGNALKATGRPIIYNLCIFYSDTTHLWGADLGNTWRTGGDIVKFIEKNPEVTYDNWYSTLQTQVLGKEKYAGPGHWNDPDNLIVDYARNNKQTIAEQKAQFSFWSLLAAPLFLGNDVRNMPQEIKEIVTNKEVIAVNQDKEGKQGTRIVSEKNYEIWVKPLSDGAKAVILFNKTISPLKIKLKKSDLDMKGKLKVRDLWKHDDKGSLKRSFIAEVDPHGVSMLKISHS